MQLIPEPLRGIAHPYNRETMAATNELTNRVVSVIAPANCASNWPMIAINSVRLAVSTSTARQ